MSFPRWRPAALVIGAVGSLAALLLAPPGGASPAAPLSGPTGLVAGPHLRAQLAPRDGEGGETLELLDRAQQYAAVRTAPAATVSSRAFTAARAQANRLPLAAGSWRQLTDQRYYSDDPHYRDATWSNSGAGYGDSSGRMSAIAVDGHTVYAGGADGGVWRSTDGGAHWTPVFDQQNDLSVGAIAVDPADHSVWVGTGEQNTSIDEYLGSGVYRSADEGRSWQLVGNTLDNALISRIAFDGFGHAYAATSQGLLRRGALDLRSAWTTVLKPDPNPTHSPYRTSFITDVAARPHTDGTDVVAALGWRGGTLPADTSYNGFYESRASGRQGSWHRLTLSGALSGASDIGRTTFSYAPGGRLYAVIESTTNLALKGVYVSPSGDPQGPWQLSADTATLIKAGSIMPKSAGENPGVQAWYNQYVLADPHNGQHVYLGLEEIFESTNGGRSWHILAPYWNFGRPCFSIYPKRDTCPMTTHSDQHAAAIGGDGVGYFGNDGGMYARPLRVHSADHWTNLNATLHTLQYYYAGVGRWPSGGTAQWGGMQDNGSSLLRPHAAHMVEPQGGDGGDVIVDPANANRAVTEYTYLAMISTTNGGRANPGQTSFHTISPSCFNPIYTPKPCDPNPRFIAPFVADIHNTQHWVAGGQYVWDNQGKGWRTRCSATSCDWKIVHNLGDGASTTSLGVSGPVTYAGWCGNGCNPGGTAPFIAGIDTNYGGSWHRISSPVLPNRIPTAIQVDPANPAKAYVVYGSFSRHWIPGGGTGHVFVTLNGGQSWTDVSGDLPDTPTSAVVLWRGKLVVGTDVGAFATSARAPGRWERLGMDLPGAAIDDLDVAPGGGYLLAATHGRGLWTLAAGY